MPLPGGEVDGRETLYVIEHPVIADTCGQDVHDARLFIRSGPSGRGYDAAGGVVSTGQASAQSRIGHGADGAKKGQALSQRRKLTGFLSGWRAASFERHAPY